MRRTDATGTLTIMAFPSPYYPLPSAQPSNFTLQPCYNAGTTNPYVQHAPILEIRPDSVVQHISDLFRICNTDKSMRVDLSTVDADTLILKYFELLQNATAVCEASDSSKHVSRLIQSIRKFIHENYKLIPETPDIEDLVPLLYEVMQILAYKTSTRAVIVTLLRHVKKHFFVQQSVRTWNLVQLAMFHYALWKQFLPPTPNTKTFSITEMLATGNTLPPDRPSRKKWGDSLLQDINILLRLYDGHSRNGYQLGPLASIWTGVPTNIDEYLGGLVILSIVEPNRTDGTEQDLHYALVDFEDAATSGTLIAPVLEDWKKYITRGQNFGNAYGKEEYKVAGVVLKPPKHGNIPTFQTAALQKLDSILQSLKRNTGYP